MIAKDAVWLVTGCSKGLGRALATELLRTGHRVVVTARQPNDVADIVAAGGDRACAVALDVTRPDAIEAALAAANARFGGIDVLVNNAGYGYLAAIEEGEDAAIRALFETNVFGPLRLAQAVLPGMRARGRGLVVNISSIGGFLTFPAVGFYHMTKFALEAMSETLSTELRPFGVGAMLVEPGAFRTDFRGPDSMKQSSVRLPEYAATAGRARDSTLARHGEQRGDPLLGARAIIAAAEAAQPPVRLVIGGDALDAIRAEIATVQTELDQWEAVTRSTDLT